MRIKTTILLAGIMVYSCMCNAETKKPSVSVIKPKYNGPMCARWLEKNYQILGPLALYIEQDPNTEKFYLYCEEELDGIEDRYDILFSDMCLISNGHKEELVGKTVNYQRCIGWTSDGLMNLKEGDILKGVVKTKLAVEKIIVEGVERTTKLKEHGISIEMKKYDGSPRYLSPLGEYGLWEVTDENKDRMYYVVAKVENSMKKEDFSFVQGVQTNYHEEKIYPRGAIISKYKQIKLKTPTILVNGIWRMPTKSTPIGSFSLGDTDESDGGNINCQYEREIQHETFFQIDRSEAGFDYIQDGNDVFPIGIELLKYEPRELGFEITYQGSGLKKLGDSSKSEPDEAR